MPEKKGSSEAQKKAHRKYMEKFVEVKVRMTPDRREMIKEHASNMGVSTTSFINNAIDEKIEKDLRESNK